MTPHVTGWQEQGATMCRLNISNLANGTCTTVAVTTPYDSVYIVGNMAVDGANQRAYVIVDGTWRQGGMNLFTINLATKVTHLYPSIFCGHLIDDRAY